AEDGIRDATVTGVQTCALPISPIIDRSVVVSTIPNRDLIPTTSIGAGSRVSPGAKSCRRAKASVRWIISWNLPLGSTRSLRRGEIGRASWREREGVRGGEAGVV